MRYRLPSLNAIRAFEAVGRRGSITAAAEELCVTPGAVSRHIGMLEQHFGQRLLVRHGRGVSLTPKGRGFFIDVAQAFGVLDGACREVCGPVADGALFVSVLTTFGTEWLAPRVERFREAHPDLDLRLTVSMDPVNFYSAEVDIGLMAGTVELPDMEEHPLFRSRFFPVCSPSLLKRGPFERFEDLRRHNLLYCDRETLAWRGWCEAAGIAQLDMRAAVKFESLTMTYQAARAGAGVALGEAIFVTDDLSSGRLVAPFKLAFDFATFRLVHPKSRTQAPGLIAFRDWVQAEVAASTDTVRSLMADFKIVSGELN